MLITLIFILEMIQTGIENLPPCKIASRSNDSYVIKRILSIKVFRRTIILYIHNYLISLFTLCS